MVATLPPSAPSTLPTTTRAAVGSRGLGQQGPTTLPKDNPDECVEDRDDGEGDEEEEGHVNEVKETVVVLVLVMLADELRLSIDEKVRRNHLTEAETWDGVNGTRTPDPNNRELKIINQSGTIK